MPMNSEFAKSTLTLDVDGVELEVAAIHRAGPLEPIVFLHGFGSTKEDYADIVRYSAFAGHPFLAYDAPGCGETRCADLSRISIPFLSETALAVIRTVGFERFHLVGHSMGGLTALMLAHAHPHRILSFVDIEGNIAPEDCFLSRQIVDHPRENAEQFLDDFIERARHAPAYASALYAASLRHKVRAAAVRGVFESMVELSDNAGLVEKFLALPCPRMFMYGEQNASLSYLPHIQAQGVRLSEIPRCGHFPMYSNPTLMWQEIGEFHATSAPADRASGPRAGSRSRSLAAPP
ncbi:alpha/beta fold hydrolase [Variovorax sp. WS11]|uniref:alpha/beta fold hydrolase n=2 Tax=Variovorax sp. WS11 TaxID=1105204 RepID=UPI0026A7AB5F